MIRIGLIGFGEVGSILSEGFQLSTNQLATYVTRPELIKDIASKKSVKIIETLPELVIWADFLFSCNSPAVAFEVAAQCAPLMQKSAVFIDCNNIFPEATEKIEYMFSFEKREFVKAVLMAPIAAHGYKVPILLGGKKSEEVNRILKLHKFNSRSVGDTPLKPAAVKMAKSLWGKGLSTLLIELYAFANASGVADEVDRFLEEMFGDTFWPVMDKYMASVVVHASRMIPEIEALKKEMQLKITSCEFPIAIESVLGTLKRLDLGHQQSINTSSSHQEITKHLIL